MVFCALAHRPALPAPLLAARPLSLSQVAIGAAAAGSLHDSAKANDFDAVQDFISNQGIDVLETDEDGKTALHYASASADRYSMADFLIANGADVNFA